MTTELSSEMIIDQLWSEVEMWFDGIGGMVLNRCYAEGSIAGARSIQLAVAGHLTWIDEALLEIESQSKSVEGEQDGI